MSFREGELEALVEMAAHLKENATDVNDALNEVENYLQILKNLAVEVGEILYRFVTLLNSVCVKPCFAPDIQCSGCF